MFCAVAAASLLCLFHKGKESGLKAQFLSFHLTERVDGKRNKHFDLSPTVSFALYSFNFFPSLSFAFFVLGIKMIYIFVCPVLIARNVIP